MCSVFIIQASVGYVVIEHAASFILFSGCVCFEVAVPQDYGCYSNRQFSIWDIVKSNMSLQELECLDVGRVWVWGVIWLPKVAGVSQSSLTTSYTHEWQDKRGDRKNDSEKFLWVKSSVKLHSIRPPFRQESWKFTSSKQISRCLNSAHNSRHPGPNI